MDAFEATFERQQIILHAVIAVTLLTTVIRLFTRAVVLRQLGLNDYLIVIANVLGIVIMVFCYVLRARTRSLDDWMQKHGTNPLFLLMNQDFKDILKIVWVGSLLYPIQMCALKLSILAFLNRFPSSKRNRGAILLLAIITGLFTVGVCLATVFQCRPVAGAWNILARKRPCRTGRRVQLASSAVNIATDILMLALPIPMLRNLQTSLRKKVGLAVVFLFGIFGTAATIARLVIATKAQTGYRGQHPSAYFRPALDLMFWSQLELDLGTICANLPALTAFGRYLHENIRNSSSSSLLKKLSFGRTSRSAGNCPRLPTVAHPATIDLEKSLARLDVAPNPAPAQPPAPEDTWSDSGVWLPE